MWGGLALALTIGLAGCGDDGPTAAREAPPVPDPTTSARKVRIHSVNATGETSAAEARKIVEFNLGKYEKCYEALLSKTPDACGFLELVLSYHRHGTWGHRGGNTFYDAEFSSCIPYKLGFPSPSLARPGSDYSFALVFAPEPSRFDECASPAIDCPAGTTLKKSKQGTTVWCVLADGKRHGPFVETHANGIKRHVGSYAGGVPDGKWEGWASDGTSLGSFELTDGTGTWIYWNEAGLKSVEISYRAGRQHGAQTNWHDNGNKSHQAEWKDGWQHGTTTSWTPDGTKTYEIRNHEGRAHGVSRRWSGGVLKRETEFFHGDRIREVTYENGKPVNTQTWSVEVPAGLTAKPRTHAKVSAEWQKCTEHHECESVSTTCCACGAGDYIGVHYKQERSAKRALAVDCKDARCPNQMCQQTWDMCQDGVCAIGQ